MEQKTTTQSSLSSQMWERLDECVREQVQRFIQALLDDEVSALLGRPKLGRLAPGDGPSGLRHGYGKPRRLSVTAGTIIVRRPRVRGLKPWLCRLPTAT
jgi:putative transposase